VSLPLGTRHGSGEKAGAADEGPTSALEQIPAAAGSDLDRLTILVADDEPAVLAHVERVLTTHGYRVLQAADGVEALEVAARHSGPIHLLLTDVAMPRLDGHELHRTLHRQRPETRTLFMSGHCDGRLHAGAAFLAKPFVVSALVCKVNELLKAARRKHRQRSSPDQRLGAAG
jgi:two-component system, cell cycle sensor histidine kinase and response regulator CckA